MRVAIIGRTEILYETAMLLHKEGHDISLIVTAKEAPGYTKTAMDFKVLADQWLTPYYATPRIRELVPAICALPPMDIGVSVSYPGIISQQVLDLFPLGILNAHGGDLPRYRGNACMAWAILNREAQIGLCIHKMNGDEMDSGDLIAKEYIPININTKVTQVWEWMSRRIPEMFLGAIGCLAANPHFILERQDKKNALRCYPRRAQDGRIDWSKTAEDILLLINASNKPYAGAYCEYKGKTMTIWDAEQVQDSENFLAVPGQVTKLNKEIVEVACGRGKLALKYFEMDGETNKTNVFIKSIRDRLE